MRRVLGLGLVFFGLLIHSVSVKAQVYEAWVARYNGPGNNYDYAYALAVDDSGNVYVTGQSLGSGTSEDYTTLKYDSNGDTLWVSRYNGFGNGGDAGYALAVDDSGNVYVTGFSDGNGTFGDCATIKYDSNGDTLWVRRYNGPGNDYDWANALAVDDSGNVYVTSVSIGSGTSEDYATIKYDSNGDTLWVRRYNGPGNDYDYPFALAVDDSGNVYVTGHSFGSGTSDDYATIKYDSNGDTLWVRRYNGLGNGSDYANALTVDDSGNVYVSGRSIGIGTLGDYTTIKYDSNGDTLWVRHYNGPGNGYDGTNALTLDNSGNVYVTGSSLGSGTSSDFTTLKYDSNGDTLWVRHYNGPGNGDDNARALAIDDSGNVYVTGSSIGSVTSEDYATIKYDSDGDTLWVRRYNGPGNSYDYGRALAIDDSGNVFVTGSSIGSVTSEDYATIKYSPCSAIAGDANSSGDFSIADIISAVNYYFNKPGWPACGSNSPLCWLSGMLCRGDWNGNGAISIGDIVHGVNYIFNKPGDWTPIATGACCLPVN